MKFSFSFFLVFDAEPLFLVDDDQPQVPELHVLLQQAVGAHHNVHGARGQPLQGVLDLFGGGEPAQQPRLHGKASIRDRMPV